MAVKSSTGKVNHIVRINKASADMLSKKGLFYYMTIDREQDKVTYVLVDNRKGNKKETTYDTIDDLMKSIK